MPITRDDIVVLRRGPDIELWRAVLFDDKIGEWIGILCNKDGNLEHNCDWEYLDGNMEILGTLNSIEERESVYPDAEQDEEIIIGLSDLSPFDPTPTKYKFELREIVNLYSPSRLISQAVVNAIENNNWDISPIQCEIVGMGIGSYRGIVYNHYSLLIAGSPNAKWIVMTEKELTRQVIPF